LSTPPAGPLNPPLPPSSRGSYRIWETSSAASSPGIRPRSKHHRAAGSGGRHREAGSPARIAWLRAADGPPRRRRCFPPPVAFLPADQQRGDECDAVAVHALRRGLTRIVGRGKDTKRRHLRAPFGCVVECVARRPSSRKSVLAVGLSRRHRSTARNAGPARRRAGWSLPAVRTRCAPSAGLNRKCPKRRSRRVPSSAA